MMIFPLWLGYFFKAKSFNSKLMQLAFYLANTLWGISVKVTGQISKKRPLLIISNHFSYLDVFALGSVMPVRFSPKSDVRNWAVIGFMCKISGQIFIDRRISQTKNSSELIKSEIDNDIISIFPEGTTNDGTKILPFKSSLFAIAENKSLTVQPVTIIYTKLNNQPINADNRHKVGWYGDMEFFPHFMQFLQQKSLEVKLVFHDSVNGKDFASRKELASYCYEMVKS